MTGLIHALLLDGKGGATALDWEKAITSTPQGDEILWIHLDYTHPQAADWIKGAAQLNPLVAQALLDENTRPRAEKYPEGTLLALRGVNLNPGEDPEDMVAIRLWLEPQRIVSTRKRPLLSIREISAALLEGEGPATPGDVVTALSERLLTRMSGVIDQVEEQIIELEELMLESTTSQIRDQLSQLRRKLITLKRYLSPQREALDTLSLIKSNLLSEANKMELRASKERLTRYLEELNEARERATVLQEEIINRTADLMNQRMYVLSLVAAIFLPLGFLTGLLGINVGGIPGSENPWAFMIFLVILAVSTTSMLWYFKLKHWL